MGAWQHESKMDAGTVLNRHRLYWGISTHSTHNSNNLVLPTMLLAILRFITCDNQPQGRRGPHLPTREKQGLSYADKQQRYSRRPCTSTPCFYKNAPALVAPQASKQRSQSPCLGGPRGTWQAWRPDTPSHPLGRRQPRVGVATLGWQRRRR